MWANSHFAALHVFVYNALFWHFASRRPFGPSDAALRPLVWIHSSLCLLLKPTSPSSLILSRSKLNNVNLPEIEATHVSSDQSQKVPLYATSRRCSMSKVGGRPWSAHFCFRYRSRTPRQRGGVVLPVCARLGAWRTSSDAHPAVLSRFEICVWAPKSVSQSQ